MQRRSINKFVGNKYVGMICVWGCILGLSGSPCGADSPAGELQRFESTQPQMGVPFKIILYVPDESTAKGAFDAAFSRIGKLNRILSDYDSDSELSRLSRAAPTVKRVALSPDLWNVLDRSQQLARDSAGAFDVTVGPYVRLWRRARRNKEMPSPQRLAEAREAVGWQSLKLDAETRTATLDRANMQLDLGGIAMGYAVDETKKLLAKRGITRVLIDASGDIAVGDPPPGKSGWTIGIVPLGVPGTPAREVLLANAAVTTAGDAFQHVVINGVRYSHIVDPRTGLGLTDQRGVAVIARDCFTADSLDTAVSVLGPEAGLKLVAATPGAEALVLRLVDGQVEEKATPGFERYVVSGEPND